MTRTPLYPLDSLSSRDSDDQESALTVLINRTVSLDDEKDFLEVLRTLLQEFDHASGTLGSKVFRSTHATHVEFSIIQRFANKSAHEAWLQSASFVRWQSEVAPEEPDPHHIRRYSGMEALFASGKDPDSPPQWKMAILLMIAVNSSPLCVSAPLRDIFLYFGCEKRGKFSRRGAEEGRG